MNALTILGLFLTLLPARAEGELPGAHFARPDVGTVLRSGAGDAFPGVLTLDGSTIVRVGERRGVYREVFVAQGFPVYMHTDYVETLPEEGLVRVVANRVNMRLLPATVGNMPVGQLSFDAPPLDLLGVEGKWVRVLTPADVPLFALGESVSAAYDGDGDAAWSAVRAARQTRRQDAAANWRATDPGWQARQQWRDELAAAAAINLAGLDESGRARHRAALDGLNRTAPTPVDRNDVDRLVKVFERHLMIEAAVAEKVGAIRRETALGGDQLAQEARVLNLGLRFSRHGEAITARGRVKALHGAGDTTIFTLHPEQGQTVLKLSAPLDVADLATLVGKEVTLTGRQLTLNSVNGPVLIVHRVLLVRR